MVQAVERVSSIDRLACRRRVAEYSSVSRMADGYEEVYSGLLSGRCLAPRPVLASKPNVVESNARDL
jgi:hypothetical protein